jgi:hypothetical protein
MAVLLGLMSTDGISHSGQMAVLWPSARQQMLDSGFISCLQHLMEATAQQLERCTAAAAAAAAASANGTGSSRTAVASHPTLAAAQQEQHAASSSLLLSLPAALELEALQAAAGELLAALILLYGLFSSIVDISDALESSLAAATHLMVAGTQYISVMLQQQQQQMQQQQPWEPPQCLVSLVYDVAKCTLATANITNDACIDLGVGILMDRGPHLLVWSDMALLLTVYANILKQQCQLPVLDSRIPQESSAGRRNQAAAGNAGGTIRSSSSSSSGNGRRQQRQRSRQMHGRRAPANAHKACLQDTLAAWQQVQGQCDRVPASHKQLLQLLGLSPQAAVWLAATMLHTGEPIYLLGPYWQCNPHKMAPGIARGLAEEVPGSAPDADVLSFLSVQQTVQQWTNKPLEVLVQPLLLYGTMHSALAASGADEFIVCCSDVLEFTVQFLRDDEWTTQQQSTVQSGNEAVSLWSSTARDELLLLTVQLVQRVQQLRGTPGPTPTSQAQN